MKLLSIKPSYRATKKLMATFSIDDATKVIHFGSLGSETFLDHKDELKKINYLKRHAVREDWSNPLTPGSLSRWILWNKPTYEASLADFKKRFGV